MYIFNAQRKNGNLVLKFFETASKCKSISLFFDNNDLEQLENEKIQYTSFTD